MQGVYRIRNVVNQKAYIGSSTNTKNRFRGHRRMLRSTTHHCKHLQAAWCLYGEECFKFEVVEEVSDVRELHDAENRWLAAMYGHGRCYNSAPTAGATWRGVSTEDHPAYGSRRTPEVRAKMSAAVKQWFADNPDKIAKGEKHYRYGQTLSAEVRKKIGDAQRGVKKAPRVLTDAGRAKILAAAAAGRYSHRKGVKRPRHEYAAVCKPVIELSTGTRFEALNDALRFFDLKMPTLRRALVSGLPLSKGPKKGLQFKYVDNPEKT